MSLRNIDNHLPDITVAQLRRPKHESPLPWNSPPPPIFLLGGLGLSHRGISLDLPPGRQVEIHRLHGGTYCHHLESQRVSQALLASFVLLFYPEDGRNNFFRSSVNYYRTTRRHRHRLSSLRFFVLYLSPSGLISGCDKTRAASFQIFSNSFIILHWMEYRVHTNSIVT
jgi:hypothetical protein